jgi:hypothetical protein
MEATLADFIRLHFVPQGRALTQPILRPLLLVLLQDIVAEGALESQALKFKESCDFMSNFLKTVGLSFRGARAQRWLILNDMEWAYFMANMITTYHRHPPHLIINFDE